MKTENSARTLWMAQTAILAAIIILMAFTPLGYLRVGALSITFLPIPVVVGAILISPATGAAGWRGSRRYFRSYQLCPVFWHRSFRYSLVRYQSDSDLYPDNGTACANGTSGRFDFPGAG